jgi:hypothetical protein
VTGQSLSLTAALAALVACILVDSYLGAAAHFLVPSLMLLAVLLLGVAAHSALRRARSPQAPVDGDAPPPTRAAPGP